MVCAFAAVVAWDRSRTLEDPDATASALRSNRYVRQRAAWALARMEPQLEQILEDVVATKDEYALQALSPNWSAREPSRSRQRNGVGSWPRLRPDLAERVDAARNRVGMNSKASAVAAGGV